MPEMSEQIAIADVVTIVRVDKVRSRPTCPQNLARPATAPPTSVAPGQIQARALLLPVSTQHAALPVEYARVPPPVVGCRYRRTNPGTRGSRGSTVNWLEPYL
jgi:hypothetical protein